MSIHNPRLSRRFINSTNGQIHNCRSDKQIKRIEIEYNLDLGKRSDMQLGTLLKQTGLSSQTQLLQYAQSKKPFKLKPK